MLLKQIYFWTRLGCLAAKVSSTLFTGVFKGDFKTSSGLSSISLAIFNIVSINSSKTAFDSVSVGSIIIASCTINGK